MVDRTLRNTLSIVFRFRMGVISIPEVTILAGLALYRLRLAMR